MRRIIPVLIVALACLASCNEKPRQYKMVQNMADGQQIIEKFEAENDTIALNQYLDRMTKIIMQNIGDTTGKTPTIESMFVISPDGDTLNTDEGMMKVIEQQLTKQK